MRRPPRSNRTDTLLPSTTLFRSLELRVRSSGRSCQDLSLQGPDFTCDALLAADAHRLGEVVGRRIRSQRGAFKKPGHHACRHGKAAVEGSVEIGMNAAHHPAGGSTPQNQPRDTGAQNSPKARLEERRVGKESVKTG